MEEQPSAFYRGAVARNTGDHHVSRSRAEERRRGCCCYISRPTSRRRVSTLRATSSRGAGGREGVGGGGGGGGGDELGGTNCSTATELLGVLGGRYLGGIAEAERSHGHGILT